MQTNSLLLFVVPAAVLIVGGASDIKTAYHDVWRILPLPLFSHKAVWRCATPAPRGRDDGDGFGDGFTRYLVKVS